MVNEMDNRKSRASWIPFLARELKGSYGFKIFNDKVKFYSKCIYIEKLELLKPTSLLYLIILMLLFT